MVLRHQFSQFNRKGLRNETPKINILKVSNNKETIGPNATTQKYPPTAPKTTKETLKKEKKIKCSK